MDSPKGRAPYSRSTLQVADCTEIESEPTSDPFGKIGKEQISVDIASVIRASDDSFRVEWVERHYADDALTATERWSAILTIVVQTPTSASQLKKNPLGVYVEALSWSKEFD